MGIWLLVGGLVMFQSWPGRKKKRKGFPWLNVLLVVALLSGGLAACGGGGTGTVPPDPGPTEIVCTPSVTPPAPGTPTDPPPPTGTPPYEWFPDEFTITHYHYPLEDDKVYADSWDVFVKGEPTERNPANPEKHLYEFIYDLEKGVVKQGTGVTKEGEHITIDHFRTKQEYNITNINEVPVDDYFFVYQEGGAYAKSIPWQTVGVSNKQTRLKPGDKVEIEIYPGRVFTVTDTGTQLAVDKGHLDVFVGEMKWKDVIDLGRPSSRVRKVGP